MASHLHRQQRALRLVLVDGADVCSDDCGSSPASYYPRTGYLELCSEYNQRRFARTNEGTNLTNHFRDQVCSHETDDIWTGSHPISSLCTSPFNSQLHNEPL